MKSAITAAPAPTLAELLNLPWHVIADEPMNVSIGDPDYERIRDAERYMGHRVAELGDWNGKEHDAKSPRVVARARFIVLACNHFDRLEARLARLVTLIEPDHDAELFADMAEDASARGLNSRAYKLELVDEARTLLTQIKRARGAA